MLHRRMLPLASTIAVGLSASLALPVSAVEAPSPSPVPITTGETDHSSDATGPVLTARRANLGSNAHFTMNQRTRPVAPGLEHTRFDRYDVRGWIRVNTLTADLSTPGLRLDYAAPGKVSSPGPLSEAMRRDRAIAGVNGDFFDIDDTGAPLGIGVDRQRGMVHGSRSGWNNSFTLNREKVAAIARTYLEASITRKGKPPVTVTNLNAPQLHAHGIGIYTAAWGGAARSRVLPTADRRREVVVRRGRVRANRKRLSSGPIPAGTLHLVGTGEGARRLARLKKGTRVSVEYGLNRAATRVAVGGNVVLLRGGEVLAPGDAEMHPRTAIGIDTDLNRVIIVAVDGRRSHSRGL
ncbi:MAG TPA: phosphodiester glycosidase family protein, partial [Nocardioidaceae bacterium]|nr:phosphodiester glycosidase family protein [Nocardioidaceae bacterium]